jgi:hypothetical protein
MMEKEVAYTLSPTHPFETSHTEGQAEHPDKEGTTQAYTLAGAQAPNLGAGKIAQAQYTRILSIFKCPSLPTHHSPKRVWGKTIERHRPG